MRYSPARLSTKLGNRDFYSESVKKSDPARFFFVVNEGLRTVIDESIGFADFMDETAIVKDAVYGFALGEDFAIRYVYINKNTLMVSGRFRMISI